MKSTVFFSVLHDEIIKRMLENSFCFLPTFGEENIRKFPKEGGARLSAPGHPIGCGSPVATSVRSTEARTEPAGENEQQPVGMGFQRGTAFHLAHDFALQSLVCYTFCDRWRGKGAAGRRQDVSCDSRTERFCNAVIIAKLFCRGPRKIGDFVGKGGTAE